MQHDSYAGDLEDPVRIPFEYMQTGCETRSPLERIALHPRATLSLFITLALDELAPAARAPSPTRKAA